MRTATMTKQRGIIFGAPMIRALLAGRKTQTRRVVKPQPGPDIDPDRLRACRPMRRGAYTYMGNPDLDPPCEISIRPRWFVGDRLWVRETLICPEDDPLSYKADGAEVIIPEGTKAGFWVGTVPSIHMPRWASRIMLEVTGVRVERLQDISEEDVKAEGLSSWTKDGRLYKWAPVTRHVSRENDPAWPWTEMPTTAAEAYAKLWDSINGSGAWERNPYVWALSFKVLAADAGRGDGE